MHIPSRLEQLAKDLSKDPGDTRIVVDELNRIALWMRKDESQKDEYTPKLKDRHGYQV